jgi:hypothetical protein
MLLSREEETAMQNRLVSINVCEPDDRRAAAYQRLTQAVKEGSAPSLTIDELQMLCRDVEAAAKDSLPTEWCLRCMWSLLSTSKANETVRAMAYRGLADNGARCRFMAFNYLSCNYPDEGRVLYEQHVNDQDPELLYSLAWFIRPHDGVKATHLLIDAIMLPTSVGLWDTLELEIIGLGEEEHLQRLREMQNEHWDAKVIADNLEMKLRPYANACRPIVLILAGVAGFLMGSLIAAGIVWLSYRRDEPYPEFVALGEWGHATLVYGLLGGALGAVGATCVPFMLSRIRKK